MFRISRFPEQLLEGEATPADVGSVLEDRGVPRRQGRRREAEDLPEGKIPGHDRQHDAERLERYEAPCGITFHDLIGQ